MQKLGLLVGLCWLTAASSCVPQDGSGVGPIDQALDSEFLIVGTVVLSDDEQISMDVEMVEPLRQGLSDQDVIVDGVVEVPIDTPLRVLRVGQRYAVFVPWTGELETARFAYDLESFEFIVRGSEARSHNDRSLDEVVECLRSPEPSVLTGDERVDVVAGLVKSQQGLLQGGFPEALELCALEARAGT